MRVVIVANGVIGEPREEFDRWIDAKTALIAADGGTVHLLAHSYTPQHVIGDMDSITPQMQTDLAKAGTTFHTHASRKDETDLELALVWAAREYPTAELVILGALGGRPDQELANILLLALPELEGRKVLIAEGTWCIRVIRGGETCTVSGSTGDTLSLIPLGGAVAGVTTARLAYPLNGDTLHFGPARGVSNVFMSEKVGVRVGTGMLWCFHERKSGGE